MEKIDTYIRVKKLQLGNQLKHRIKVYLDMNYWIRMRECFSGKPQNKAFANLYENLSKHIKDKKVICPISQRIFYELIKQEDSKSLLLTAKLMDQFSEGVSILSEPEREQSELFYYIRERILGESNLISIDEYIWAKAPYVLGIAIPENSAISRELQYEIQSKFLDYSWEITLEEMVCKLYGNIPKEVFRNKSVVDFMNIGKITANKNITSLKHVFIDELNGALSIYKDMILDFYNHIYLSNPEVLLKLTNKDLDSPEKLLKLIFAEIKDDTIDIYLPSLVIQICLHSLMRWDKNRLFKTNDLEDIFHAGTALPYFDVFLTEKPLTQLIKMGPYKLNLRYDIKVEYNPTEAINIFEKL